MDFPIKIDATGLSALEFLISGVTGPLPTNVVHELRLQPAKYEFEQPYVGRVVTFEVTANDRRFLRSLRIAADETAEPVE